MSGHDDEAVDYGADFPAWQVGPIEQYLRTAPERGDWSWEDHCNGLAGGILAALQRAGVALVPAGELRNLRVSYETVRAYAKDEHARAERLLSHFGSQEAPK